MSSRASASRWGLLLAAAYLAAALHGLGASDIVGDDEAREAGIVQDVVTGHWLWPRFNGELLPDKPILYHWLAALPCAAAGFSETAVRLPSALAGAALVGWTAALGADLLGASAGLAAAALLATTPALFTHARVARPDVLLVLLLSLALGSAFRWWRDGRRRDATAALAFLGAATLAKGPVGPALFALTLGGFLAWQRELRRLPRVVTLPGLAVLVVLGLGWYAVALAGWGRLFVHEHLAGRYLRNLTGGLAAGRPYSPKPLAYHLLFYVKHLPAVALPWTPFTALALWRAWRTGGFRDPRLRFLLCWAAAPLVAFTPAEWKLRYYLLPSLPALALLTAPAVLRLVAEPARRLSARGLLALATGAAAGLGGLALAQRSLPLSPSDRSTLDALLRIVPGGPPAAAAGTGFLAGVLLVALAWRAWAALLAAVATATVLWMAAGQPALEAAVSRRDSLKLFASAVAARYPPPAPLAFWRDPIRPVAVYVGRPMPTLRRPEDVTPGLALVGSEPALRRLLDAGVIGFPMLEAEGRVGNITRGRVMLMEITPRRAARDRREPAAVACSLLPGPGTTRISCRSPERLATLTELARNVLPGRARRFGSRNRVGSCGWRRLQRRAELLGGEPALAAVARRPHAVARPGAATRPPGDDLHLGAISQLRDAPTRVVRQRHAARDARAVDEQPPSNGEHGPGPARLGTRSRTAGWSKRHRASFRSAGSHRTRGLIRVRAPGKEAPDAKLVRYLSSGASRLSTEDPPGGAVRRSGSPCPRGGGRLRPAHLQSRAHERA